ncbi:Scr1 family TA system antitoxin-like transcriptional regulator [Streptomyces xiamenensis]|uniref:Scr1 family TA system antitoxin-like transcriptional regulator n=1 Tax=Streptomyces xiamenensis TaxID=408015 RepID=UPI0036E0A0AF
MTKTSSTRASRARHTAQETGADIGRYLLGMELLRLRHTARLRQADAVRAGVSPARLSQAERGLTELPSARISALLNLYRATRPERADLWALHDAIPPAPADGEDPAGEFQDRAPGRWGRLAGMTGRAEAVTEFGTGYMPARVQTAEYAAALLRERAQRAGPDVVMALTGRCGPVRGEVVITQPMLSSTVGGRWVMAGQLEHLARLAGGDGLVVVRVIPLGVVPAVQGALRLLTPVAGHPGVVARIHPAHITYHAEALARITVRHVVEQAADAAWSAAMIRAAARRYGALP